MDFYPAFTKFIQNLYKIKTRAVTKCDNTPARASTDTSILYTDGLTHGQMDGQTSWFQFTPENFHFARV